MHDWDSNSPHCTRDLSLEYQIVHADYNEMKLAELANDLSDEIEITEYQSERLYRITNWDPKLDLKRLLRARGIVPLEEYIARISRGTGHIPTIQN